MKIERTIYDYINHSNNKQGTMIISRYPKIKNGTVVFTCGKEVLMFDKRLTDYEVIDNLSAYEQIESKELAKEKI